MTSSQAPEGPAAKATNIVWHHSTVTRAARAHQRGHRSAILWFTGLSGAGKSTLANAVNSALFEQGLACYVLDGDNVRHGLNKDLGFTQEDRVENIRRVAEVAKLMVDAGLIVICTLISPYRADREMARALFQEGEFFEVFVDTPLEVCEARDPKGLYKKARSGELKNFTGIDQQYENPKAPELRISAENTPLDVIVGNLLELVIHSTAKPEKPL